ncbi:hypothetical protein DOY81_011077, partial [Sarcophaga bullata]
SRIPYTLPINLIEMSNLSKTTASLVKRTSFSAAVTPSIIPHHLTAQAGQQHQQQQQQQEEVNQSKGKQNHSNFKSNNADIRSYDEVPGPRGMPFIGNSWRFAPVIGHYKISELDKVMKELHVKLMVK